MKIGMLWPQGLEIFYSIPLGLAYIISSLDNSCNQIELYDFNLTNTTPDSKEFHDFLARFQPDLVGISTWSMSYMQSMQALHVVKEVNPRIITIIGGPHASVYPDKTIENFQVDYLFRGEAEKSFPIFIDELSKGDQADFSGVKGLVYRKNGKIIKNEPDFSISLDEIPIPNYDLINLDEYLKKGYRYNARERNAPILLTRGCPYNCGFCSAPIINGKQIRYNSLEYTIKWVNYLYHEKKIRHINIIDDNFTFHVNFAKDFCRMVIELNLPGLKFGTPNGIRIQKSDLELFYLMKKAGWERIMIAPESGSERILKLMKKGLNLDIIPEKVKEIKKAGLKVHAFFIIGYPGETEDDIKQTEKFIKQCFFDSITISNFQPLPGTPIYNWLVEDDQISDSLLPSGYTTGERPYTPKELKDFNFSKFILKMHFIMIIKNPKYLIFMFSEYNPIQVLKRIASNIFKVFFPRSDFLTKTL